jgi:hypothetical protein
VDPGQAVQDLMARSVLDTMHAMNFRAHLELLSRTEPRTFMAYVAMCIPKQKGADNRTQVNTFISAIPKGPLDALPPGFDLHR